MPEQVRTVSKSLVAELARLCQCPPDYIMLECLHTTAIFDGDLVPSYPFIEVNWFDRGGETMDLVAACIDRHVRSLGIPEAEVAFRLYEPSAYYANGERLAPRGDNIGEQAQAGQTPRDGATGEQAPHDEAAAALDALRQENARLKAELAKARKTPQAGQAGTGGYMSSKLRDALRE